MILNIIEFKYYGYVIPAQAGIQVLRALGQLKQTWIPACAGMTGSRQATHFTQACS